MRIAWLLPSPGIPVQGPSGASAHVRNVCAALRAKSDLRLFAVRRFDHRGAFGTEMEAEISGVASWPSWLSFVEEMREIRSSRRLVSAVLSQKDWTPQLIIERHSLFSDAGWRLSDRLGIPWILEVNAPLVQERLRYESVPHLQWAQRWERSVLQAAPAIITVSRWLQNWLQEEIGCRNVLYVPNGANALRGDRCRGRKLLGLTKEEPVVGLLASMKPWHGVERLARVAREVGATSVLIGQGCSADMADKVCSFFAVQDLADVVAALDVGLAPYPEDSPPWFCPLKILDYRAQGVPVVASAVGDVPELVGSGGTVCPPGDDEQLISAVHSWLGKRPEADLRSWEDVADEILSVAEPLISAKVATVG